MNATERLISDCLPARSACDHVLAGAPVVGVVSNGGVVTSYCALCWQAGAQVLFQPVPAPPVRRCGQCGRALPEHRERCCAYCELIGPAPIGVPTAFGVRTGD